MILRKKIYKKKASKFKVEAPILLGRFTNSAGLLTMLAPIFRQPATANIMLFSRLQKKYSPIIYAKIRLFIKLYFYND